MKLARRPALRRGFTLIELLVVIAIIAFMVAMFMPPVQAARDAARRTQCANNLKQLGIASYNYAQSYGMFPVGMDFQSNASGPGKFPSNSSFVTLLPFMEQSDLYNSVNFHVNIRSTANFTVSANRVAILWCPSERGKAGPRLLPENAMLDPGPTQMFYTSYAGCVGTWFQWRPENSKNLNGIFRINESTSIADIKDGMSSTILFSERAHTILNDNEAPWWHWWTYGNNGDTLCNTLFPMNVLDRPSGKGKSAEAVAYLSGASSMHPGGCNFLFADGSVRYIANTIDSWPADLSTGLPAGITFESDGTPRVSANIRYGIYQRLSTRDGSEPIPDGSF